MKPTFQFHDARPLRDSFVPRRDGSASPKTDYHFRPSAADFAGRSRGEGYPSFRGISRDYFDREARGHFASEAFVFGLIVLTVALPIIEGIRAMLAFVYGAQ